MSIKNDNICYDFLKNQSRQQDVLNNEKASINTSGLSYDLLLMKEEFFAPTEAPILSEEFIRYASTNVYGIY